MNGHKLTTKEIDKAIERLREEYDHYIVHFGKTAESKRRFEDRLLFTLQNRRDMTVFVAAEMQAVKELLAEAKAELENPPPPVQAAKPSAKKSYADQVIEELQARIKDYPSLRLPEHAQKSLDVEKLYGTLQWFRDQIWKLAYPILARKNPQPQLYRLDDELNTLTPWNERLPKEIENYVHLLTGDADMSHLAKAQNRCLLQGAQFLHRVRNFAQSNLQIAAENGWASERASAADIDMLKKTVAFADRVLSDFRLKDFRPQDP